MNSNLESLLSRCRSYPGVTVVAVSKTATVQDICTAWGLGLREFGENRVQDALAKQAEIDLPITWHFVGRLQRNKVRLAAGKFSLYHSLGNVPLAEEMNRVAMQSGYQFPCLVQVNTADDVAKDGFPLNKVTDFLEISKTMPGIAILGLMTIGPHLTEPAPIRQVFRATRRLFEQLKRAPVAAEQMIHLSMGMSADFELALEEGATMVRIGSAIFSNLGENRG